MSHLHLCILFVTVCCIKSRCWPRQKIMMSSVCCHLKGRYRLKWSIFSFGVIALIFLWAQPQLNIKSARSGVFNIPKKRWEEKNVLSTESPPTFKTKAAANMWVISDLHTRWCFCDPPIEGIKKRGRKRQHEIKADRIIITLHSVQSKVSSSVLIN